MDNKIDLSNEESPKIKENIKKNIQIFSTDHTGHYKLAYKLFLNQSGINHFPEITYFILFLVSIIKKLVIF